MSNLITADATKLSPSQFIDAVFGPSRYSREEAGERALALTEHHRAMRVRKANLTEQLAYDNECYARYAERLREISDKYALTVCEGDPLLKRRAA